MSNVPAAIARRPKSLRKRMNPQSGCLSLVKGGTQVCASERTALFTVCIKNLAEMKGAGLYLRPISNLLTPCCHRRFLEMNAYSATCSRPTKVHRSLVQDALRFPVPHDFPGSERPQYGRESGAGGVCKSVEWPSITGNHYLLKGVSYKFGDAYKGYSMTSFR
jgi:hypothetical protein